MTNTPSARRRKAGALSAALAGASALLLCLPSTQAAAAAPAGPDFVQSAEQVAVDSLVHSTGSSRADAQKRLQTQQAGRSLADSLTERLGSRAVGAFLDATTGSAVVNVLSEADAQQVRAAGATPKFVRYNASQLDEVKTTLDRLAGVPNTSWGVDTSANQVVLTISHAAPADRAAELVQTAQRFGDRVRVQRSTGQLTEHVYDGQEISTGQILCSAGFNVVKGGTKYIVTAGHCTRRLPYWQGIGPSTSSRFAGTDYGLIRNGYGQPITSAGNAYVGEQVCKSGRTTYLTCGTVQALNQTVNYGNGDVVYGLIQTNVRSDHGDSGGPLFDGSTALGTVSGGDNVTDYFQPVTAALSYYGVTLAP
jgi:streptogrisin D